MSDEMDKMDKATRAVFAAATPNLLTLPYTERRERELLFLTGMKHKEKNAEAERRTLILKLGAYLQTAHGSGDEIREHFQGPICELLMEIGIAHEWCEEVGAKVEELGLNKGWPFEG